MLQGLGHWVAGVWQNFIWVLQNSEFGVGKIFFFFCFSNFFFFLRWLRACIDLYIYIKYICLLMHLLANRYTAGHHWAPVDAQNGLCFRDWRLGSLFRHLWWWQPRAQCASGPNMAMFLVHELECFVLFAPEVHLAFGSVQLADLVIREPVGDPSCIDGLTCGHRKLSSDLESIFFFNHIHMLKANRFSSLTMGCFFFCHG